MKARMSLWEELWAEPLANTPSYWCSLIPPLPLHRGKYKRGRPTETYSDTQAHTNTHPRVREGHSFEWVIQWETWQRWACWKTVLPLFAGPLQKRQWSGANRWTSCWSTNVRYFYPSLDVYNELVVFDEFLWLGLNPQGWRLYCCIVLGMHASSPLPALSHWMNALLNMLNGFHSDPRWVLDPYGVRERPLWRIYVHHPYHGFSFLIKLSHSVMLKVLVTLRFGAGDVFFRSDCLKGWVHPHAVISRLLWERKGDCVLWDGATLPSILILATFRSERKCQCAVLL